MCTTKWPSNDALGREIYFSGKGDHVIANFWPMECIKLDYVNVVNMLVQIPSVELKDKAQLVNGWVCMI